MNEESSVEFRNRGRVVAMRDDEEDTSDDMNMVVTSFDGDDADADGRAAVRPTADGENPWTKQGQLLL